MSASPSPKQIAEQYYIRDQLLAGRKSAARRYADLVVGEGASYGQLLKYELVTGLFGGLPGALGLALRQLFYPRLFKKVGQGVVFGRHIVIRNARNVTLGDQVIVDDLLRDRRSRRRAGRRGDRRSCDRQPRDHHPGQDRPDPHRRRLRHRRRLDRPFPGRRRDRPGSRDRRRRQDQRRRVPDRTQRPPRLAVAPASAWRRASRRAGRRGRCESATNA